MIVPDRRSLHRRRPGYARRQVDARAAPELGTSPFARGARMPRYPQHLRELVLL
jgi:hypothetical protein